MTTTPPQSPSIKTQNPLAEVTEGATFQRSQTAATSSKPSDDGSHLDDFTVAEIDEADGGPDQLIQLDENGEPFGDLGHDDFDDAPAQLDKDAFFEVFCIAFNVPGQIMPDFARVGISEPERPAARAASDAAYRLLEIWYPQALQPGSETVAHLIVLGPFLIGKAMIVREVLRVRKMPAPPPPAEATPANTDAEPKEFVSDPSISADWEVH